VMLRAVGVGHISPMAGATGEMVIATGVGAPRVLVNVPAKPVVDSAVGAGHERMVLPPTDGA